MCEDLLFAQWLLILKSLFLSIFNLNYFMQLVDLITELPSHWNCSVKPTNDLPFSSTRDPSSVALRPPWGCDRDPQVEKHCSSTIYVLRDTVFCFIVYHALSENHVFFCSGMILMSKYWKFLKSRTNAITLIFCPFPCKRNSTVEGMVGVEKGFNK